jgi:hypothetical protein
MPITKRIVGLNLLLVIFLVLPLSAQEEAAEGGEDASAAAGANNPLADITSFQLQNYYASDLYGMPNESSNTAWMRFVKPIGKVLLRASLPLSTVPATSGDSISGIGDLNMFFEPQFTIAHDGEGYPSFQVFAAINLQLLPK